MFLSTAGAGISEHATKISTESDPIPGCVFDVIGSVTVEKATDTIQSDLMQEVQKDEWSVAKQQKLFSLLPENFCGIKLSYSSLNHPLKSLSGNIW